LFGLQPLVGGKLHRSGADAPLHLDVAHDRGD
jgi:hypothetical protein